MRDILLGTSVKDLDFVVEGDGPQVARRLAAELGGEVLAHERFGTSTLVRGRSRVDVVTARREVYPHPATLPQVSPGSINDDLARRDFSINALTLPLGKGHPEVLDPHGGVDDIRRGLIRTLHPASFVDDPTRIFRAVRYEQRFAFTIEDSTLSQLHDAIEHGHLSALSSDRLRHELERILEDERPELPLDRAMELGAMAAIHPSLGDSQAGTRVKSIAVHNATSKKTLAPGHKALVYIGALTYSLTQAQGEAVISRLNMPNTWAKVVRDVIALRDLEEHLALPDLWPSRVVSLVESFCPESVLSVSLLTDSATVAQRLREYLNEFRYVVTALNGNELLALGVPAGPMVGRILRELREARLDNRVSIEEERRLVRKILNKEEGRSQHG